ncbi:MAG TPA: hypothetical protein VFQ38_18335, partial [Longimicrobiales bacterium]|nr:hypothetical protein [Longimicrobiales bacterium]
MTRLPDEATAPRRTPTAGQLVVGLLTVCSSYAAEREEAADGRPDTIQWYLGPTESWRVRTYALDHDIHVHRTDDMPADPVAFVRAHVEKHYGDVLDRLVVLELPADTTPDSARAILAAAGLPGVLEVARAGFAFVNPDAGTYRS